MEVPRFRWSEPGRWRLSLAPASVGRWFLRLNRQHGFFPLHPWFAYKKRLQTTRPNIAGNQRTFYVKLLCNRSLVLHSTRGADGGGFEPPVPFGTHAFQACTIDRSVTHPLKRSHLARRS